MKKLFIVIFVLLLVGCSSKVSISELKENRLQLKEYSAEYVKKTGFSTNEGITQTQNDYLSVWETEYKGKFYLREGSKSVEVILFDDEGKITVCFTQETRWHCDKIPYEENVQVITNFLTDYSLQLLPENKEPKKDNTADEDKLSQVFEMLRKNFEDRLKYVKTNMRLGEEEYCFKFEPDDILPESISYDVEICYNVDGIITLFSSHVKRKNFDLKETIELVNFERKIESDAFDLPAESKDVEGKGPFLYVAG